MLRIPHPGRAMKLLAGVLLCSLPAVISSASVPDLPPMSGEHVELRIETEADGGAIVVVSGLGDAAKLSQAAAFTEDDWRTLLHVVARDPDRSAEGTDLPSLLGRYALEDSTLRFEPRFPPAPGLVIEASFDARLWNEAATGTQQLTASYVVPRTGVERTTRVEAVYPAVETVPANLLRFYVHFSGPMSKRHVLRHIALLDHEGQAIETAFVEVEGGLWDPSRTRLTLFVHPGRVKRGVGPNLALGPALEVGKSYTLRIAEDAADDFGRRLAEPFEHSFSVGAEDHVSPDPERWTLTPPTAPDDPLRVELVEPADVALLQRILIVVDAEGQMVEGRIHVSVDGASFEFHPESGWESGEYELRIPSTLEDASGNRVGGLFEEAANAEPAGEDLVRRRFRKQSGVSVGR